MSSEFGNIIRQWRDIRRFSQLGLSTESGLSSRHISFLETGRAKPSRGAVMTLGRVLDMPKSVINQAMLAAGFAPEYRELSLGDADLQPALDAIDMMLANHDPMPAIVIDQDWNIIGGNQAADMMVSLLPFYGSRCIVDALLNDDADNPIFLNWSVVATWTMLRLQHEIGHMGGHDGLEHLYARLKADPRREESDLTSFTDYGPVLTMQAQFGGQVLTFFTMLAEFSTVQDLTISERRVELFFPGDIQTKAFFEAMS